MPKRKREDPESLNGIMKEIRRLERKLFRGRRRRSSSSSESPQLSSEIQDDTNFESDNVRDQIQDINEPGPSTRASGLASAQPIDATVKTQEAFQPAGEQNQATDKNDQQIQELLKILGPDPSTSTVFGKEIHKDLAICFEFITTSGLTKKRRKELLDSHLPPGNCKLIDAPTLNAELKAAVTEAVVERDKAIQAKQKQIGSAIACLSDAITLLISKEIKDLTILKLLIDTGRILCDSQHNDSVTRRNLIMAVLKKELRGQMQSTKIDSLLFGQKLANILKTTKVINKSDAELKSLTPKTGPANKLELPQFNKNLNCEAPALRRRPTGPLEAKEAAASTRHERAHSYRTSQPSTSRGHR